MYDSTVTFSDDNQRQLMLKQICMCTSELKERRTVASEIIGVNMQRDIEKLAEFKYFFEVKGTFTIRMCDIVLIRNLLSKVY